MTMQQTLFITVQGSQRTIDMALPGDIPLYELFPFLLSTCGTTQQSVAGPLPPPGVSFSVVRLQETLSPAFTLLESGMVDGDILQVAVSASSASSLLAQPPVPESIQPGPLTGGIGITWQKEW